LKNHRDTEVRRALCPNPISTEYTAKLIEPALAQNFATTYDHTDHHAPSDDDAVADWPNSWAGGMSHG
jgi:hypothetical protein